MRGDELAAAHLEREQPDRRRLHQRDVLGDVQRERRLAHAGAGREDHEVGRVDPRQLLVEVREPRRLPRGGAGVLRQLLDAEQLLVHDLRDLVPAAGPAALAERGDLARGSVEELAHVVWLQVGLGREVGGDPDELPEHRLLADDARVERQVRRGRRVLRQLRDVAGPAEPIGLLAAEDPLGHGDEVDRLGARPHLDQELVERPVFGPVEVLRLDHLFEIVERVGRGHDPAQQRSLCFERVRERAIASGVHAAASTVASSRGALDAPRGRPPAGGRPQLSLLRRG
jgi:hypothetical protein